MRNSLSFRAHSLLLFSLLLSCAGGRAQRASSSKAAQAARLDLSSAPPASADRLYAQLWMQASPEYRSLCRLVFQSALIQIRKRISEAPQVEGRPAGASGRPLAVVTDLDETILDNSGYQAQLVLSGVGFTRRSWNQWVRQRNGVGLIPGAGPFLKSLEHLRVPVVFISNRPDSLREDTIATLEGLGIGSGLRDSSQLRLLLRRETSSKEARRRQVEQLYEVVAFLGDNLGDFPASLPPSLPERLAAIRRYDSLWGRRWFLLPNPAYGSWTRPFRKSGPLPFLQQFQKQGRP